MNEPGLNPIDEARRATADLCRLTRLWECVADSNVYALDEFDYVEDETKPEDSPERFVAVRNKRLAELLGEASSYLPAWEAAINRAVLAMHKVEWSALGLKHEPIVQAIIDLRRIFQKPMVDPADKSTSAAHLFRAGGPLYADRKAGSNFALLPIREILAVLADFSDTLGLLDGAGVKAVLRQDEGCVYRESRWFRTATRGGLYSDLLRMAATDGRLTESTNTGKRWFHSVREVCSVWPHYRDWIMTRLRDDLAKVETKSKPA
tara:strand:+ start:10379 stop:11167 length:789 start_codon:yes stop_codon:yes gene_type:complete